MQYRQPPTSKQAAPPSQSNRGTPLPEQGENQARQELEAKKQQEHMQNLKDLNAEYMQIIQHQKEQLKTFKDEKKELEERLAEQEEKMVELKQSQEHN